jgi:hypothetical protein
MTSSLMTPKMTFLSDILYLCLFISDLYYLYTTTRFKKIVNKIYNTPIMIEVTSHEWYLHKVPTYLHLLDLCTICLICFSQINLNRRKEKADECKLQIY